MKYYLILNISSNYKYFIKPINSAINKYLFEKITIKEYFINNDNLKDYNWFAIKIKNISADTQVFADEFLTKSAELYSLD